ncbi:uncharacterized protein METZ01_LOCUS507070 [marine metagenome]|uniref:LysM domain-containing protein n=1 Tax=marine metagenome TaxID=408172 RepID=A0A383EBK8_9ZZZZ
MAYRNNLIRLLFLFILLSIVAGCQILRYLDILSPDQRGIYHTVQEGQTLYFIAHAYDINVNRLKQINRIYDPSKLQIGTRLWIPGARQVLEVGPKNSKQPVAQKKGSTKKNLKIKKEPQNVVKGVKGFLIWPE